MHLNLMFKPAFIFQYTSQHNILKAVQSFRTITGNSTLYEAVSFLILPYKTNVLYLVRRVKRLLLLK